MSTVKKVADSFELQVEVEYEGKSIPVSKKIEVAKEVRAYETKVAKISKPGHCAHTSRRAG